VCKSFIANQQTINNFVFSEKKMAIVKKDRVRVWQHGVWGGSLFSSFN
jgi:hypothetical protein